MHIENMIMKNSASKNTQKVTNKKAATDSDLKDSEADEKKLQQESFTIDMPEVKDIPGQENIRVPRIREMEDTTISSSDEEGDGILDSLNREDDDDNSITNTSDITKEEKNTLRKSAEFTDNPERKDLEKMALDNRDDEGEELNEKGFAKDRFGEDLDVPGSELDDEDEDAGEEDEENNLYSGRD
jgi:hypothetical protein